MSAVSKILEKYGESEDKLLVTSFTENDDGLKHSYVLLEGTSTRLRFLGELLIALANAEECDFFMHPTGPGLNHFASESNLGVIIHRTPCEHGSMARV